MRVWLAAADLSEVGLHEACAHFPKSNASPCVCFRYKQIILLLQITCEQPAWQGAVLGGSSADSMTALLEESSSGDDPGGGSGGPVGARAVLMQAILPSLPGDVQQALKAQLLGYKVRGGKCFKHSTWWPCCRTVTVDHFCIAYGLQHSSAWPKQLFELLMSSR